MWMLSRWILQTRGRRQKSRLWKECQGTRHGRTSCPASRSASNRCTAASSASPVTTFQRRRTKKTRALCRLGGGLARRRAVSFWTCRRRSHVETAWSDAADRRRTATRSERWSPKCGWAAPLCLPTLLRRSPPHSASFRFSFYSQLSLWLCVWCLLNTLKLFRPGNHLEIILVV